VPADYRTSQLDLIAQEVIPRLRGMTTGVTA